MKRSFFILFLLISTNILAQTRTETQEWIVEKYNEFERVNSLSHTMDLFVEDDFLYYEYLNSLFKVKIKDIKEIEFKQERFNNKDKEGWISLWIRFENGSLLHKGANERDFSTSTDTAFKIILSSELGVGDYQKRMEKALLHLVKSYDGNAKIKKEAF